MQPSIETASQISEIASLIEYLAPEERAEVDRIIADSAPVWVPQPGPQTDAYYSPADILYYGGSAGGGKSDLLLGLSLTAHKKSIIYRRESTQNIALEDRLLSEILKSRDGWNGKDSILRRPDYQIELGSCKNAGDEIKYQGRPHDLKCFDEITHFLESQFRFLIGWLRSADSKQRKRIVCAGNPPTNQDGQWVIKFWAPWLDKTHPNPAQPGELRWFTTIDGKDVERPDGNPFEHKGQWITPLSRTFIPSRVRDNVFMIESGYEAMLQALPEPLRSQMLDGDFSAGVEENQWQVCPTAWVEAAMDRWSEDGKKGPMTSCGADIARGGQANTVVSVRHDNWFDRLHVFPGVDTPDGASSAGVIISVIRDGAPVHVDVIGVGGSTYDHLNSNNIQVVPVNFAARTEPNETDRSGHLKFKNDRAMHLWKFREALDPKTGNNIALPPDNGLKTGLCAPTWFLTPQGIQIESKEQILHGRRLHKTSMPLGNENLDVLDKADAVVMCWIDTQKEDMDYDNRQTHADNNYDYFGGAN